MNFYLRVNSEKKKVVITHYADRKFISVINIAKKKNEGS